MKTIRLIMFIILVISIDNTFAQPIPPAHGNGLNQAPSGGGAPIDKGTIFLVSFASIYLCLKYYLSNKKESIAK